MFIKSQFTQSRLNTNLQQASREAFSLNQQAFFLLSADRSDEAIEVLKLALKKCPSLSLTHHNLGAIYETKRQLDEATACYLQGLQLDPKAEKTHYNIANIYRAKGDSKKAIQHLRQVLEINPKHHSAGYILAVCQGQTPDRAPPEFVKQLFDQYSSKFEESLVQGLNYKTPSLLLSLFNDVRSNEFNIESLVDLGCGTGLSGDAFKAVSTKMTGVDISPKMLEQCKTKGIYESLTLEDILSYLRTTEAKFDLCLSVDALIYFGNLRFIFEGVSRILNPQAYFAFSTEACEGNGLALTKTGRYAHSYEYVLKSAKNAGFNLAGHSSNEIRIDSDDPVKGNLFVFRK